MDEIGAQLDIDKSTVSRIIEKLQNGKNADLQQNFSPQLYNIWNFARNITKKPI